VLQQVTQSETGGAGMNAIRQAIKQEQSEARERERMDNHIMRCKACGWVGTEAEVARNSIGSGHLYCPGKQKECSVNDWEIISEMNEVRRCV